MRKKAYKSVPVKGVDVSAAVSRLPEGRLVAGIDVGKTELLVVLRGEDGTILRPWSVSQPRELPLLVERLKAVRALRKDVVVALEPTGTYGDALRQSLGDAGFVVQRVSPKASSDYAEVFDGVPSQHDGKDAAVIAELAAIGKGRVWPPPEKSESDRALLYQVQWMDTQQDVKQLWLGRLEAHLARHWPEVLPLLSLDSVTLLRVLEDHGGPAGLASDPEAAATLKRYSRGLLKEEKIQAVLSSAKSTQGVRMTAAEIRYMQQISREIRRADKEVDVAHAALEAEAKQDPVLSRMGGAVGWVTACVLWVCVGDPRDYSSGAAYRKALGLNLKERSSGQHQGQLKISKRGPSLARRWLYFAALRLVQDHSIKPWFQQKKARDQNRGGRAVVAVMRKLALAVYAVATSDAEFDPARVFPGKPLPAPAGGRASQPALGALPPDPRDLSLEGQVQREVEGQAQNTETEKPTAGSAKRAAGKRTPRPPAASDPASGRRSGRFSPEPCPSAR